jgi:hypothetical protein
MGRAQMVQPHEGEQLPVGLMTPARVTWEERAIPTCLHTAQQGPLPQLLAHLTPSQLAVVAQGQGASHSSPPAV